MFSSLFSAAADPKAPNFHPVTSKTAPSELFGQLTPKDTEWTCAGGFVTETQVWYHLLEDGTFIMCQIIHSAVGMWYPTIQFTSKVYNPTTKEQTWKSINVSNFVTPPPGKDKRSSKADQFTVTHSSGAGDIAEQYVIHANLDQDLQIALTVSRPASAAGFKVGRGESYFGVDPAKAEGYVVHRFWPRTQCSGHIIHKGRAIEANGVGMFVHAIQGMRPNLVAARWNFANFQSSRDADVSAVQMDFSTIDAYGRHGAGSGGVTVSVGGVVVGGKLVCVTGETIWPDEPPVIDAAVQSRAVHLAPVLDPETGYRQPTRIRYTWQGPAVGDAKGDVKAELEVDVGTPEAPKGLLEKVDVLAEIPYALKMVVNYVAGTKPYIYQWLNPGTLSLTGPESVIPGGSTTVEGTFYNEATFISESVAHPA
ncbi:putative cell survival pathways protein [Ceratobasidium sp. 394]|nr:putative cell survival pathways protein [Ceratobasidium sp. 394]